MPRRTCNEAAATAVAAAIAAAAAEHMSYGNAAETKRHHTLQQALRKAYLSPHHPTFGERKGGKGNARVSTPEVGEGVNRL